MDIKGRIKSFFSSTVTKDGQVSNLEAVKYGLGITGQNISCGLVGWVSYYCNVVLGVPIGIIGAILTITRIWDAVNDPLMGSLIDRHRFKNGEKLRPFLKYAALVAGFSFAGVFFSAYLFHDTIWLFCLTVFLFYLIYDMSFTVQDLSMWGMTSVMTSVPEERSRLAQIGRIFATVGTWLPGLVTPFMAVADFIGLKWKYLFLIFAVVMGAGGMAMSMLAHSAKERVRTPKPNKAEVSLRDNLNLLFKNKIVMLILLGSIVSGLSLGVGAIYFFIFKIGFTITILGVEMSTTAFLFIFELLMGLPSVLAMFFAQPLKRLFGNWKNVMVFSFALIIFARIICYFIGFEGNNILIVMVIMSVAGILGGLNGIAVTSLLGDSLDIMEFKTGLRGEGITFAAQVFSSKIGGAVNTGVFTILMLIQAFDTTNFDAYKNGEITELAGAANFAKVAWELYMLGPIVGALCNMIPLLFIKYSEKERDEIVAILKERRALAEKPTTESDSDPSLIV